MLAFAFQDFISPNPDHHSRGIVDRCPFGNPDETEERREVDVCDTDREREIDKSCR